MCLRPIKLRNLVKYKFGGMEFINCSCRHCSECADVASNDYVVRSIALFNSLPDYSFFFCTLTFNEQSVPRTNIYKHIDGKWQVVQTNVRCFNHELYRRFRKNFSEYFVDNFGKKVHMLTTCEFGEHSTKRPHYHCIIAVPVSNLNWKLFKSIIERYWHYGFTKDVTIAQIDGIKHRRSPLNCIKYVTKYVSKFNTKLPYYLKYPDTYCTDFPPYDIKVRVFVTKGFGDSLSSILTHANYVNNSVVLNFDKKYKEYSIPYYYQRKYFTRVVQVLEDSYYPPLQGFPYDDKLLKRKKFIRRSITYRRNGYDLVLFDNFKSRLRTLIHNYNNDMLFDEHLNEYLDTWFQASGLNYVDLTLSPNLFDDMVTYYLQTTSPETPTSPSPVPLSSHREYKHYRMYLKPWTDSYTVFHKRFNSAQASARKHGLPWIDLPSLPVLTTAPQSYTLPPDWHKLEWYQHYKRNCRLHQSLLKSANDEAWHNQHTKPYMLYDE